MFDIYLPIAEVFINAPLLLLISTIVGLLTGMLGIGGGFLMTPILIFFGIPPIYAVANGANNILAASVSGTLAHYFKGQLDLKMGALILVGGIVGSIIGIEIFNYFLNEGSINNIISILFFGLLTLVGPSMLFESLSEIRRINNRRFIRRKLHKHYWIHNLPFKTRIRSSKLYISVIPPIFFGILIGLLSSILGVGGAFLLVPILIYIIGMPAKLVPGTSLLAMIFVMIGVTLLHALQNNTIDFYLVLILVLGSVTGAQIGTYINIKMKGEQLRAILSVVVLGCGLKFGYDLFQQKIIPAVNITNLKGPIELNSFSQGLINISNQNPEIYAIFSITVAIVLGIIVAYSFKKLF